jgi:hypothetical protein
MPFHRNWSIVELRLTERASKKPVKFCRVFLTRPYFASQRSQCDTLVLVTANALSMDDDDNFTTAQAWEQEKDDLEDEEISQTLMLATAIAVVCLQEVKQFCAEWSSAAGTVSLYVSQKQCMDGRDNERESTTQQNT